MIEKFDKAYQWETQPEASQLLREIKDYFLQRSSWLGDFRETLLRETGTRLIDWIDSVSVGNSIDSSNSTNELTAELIRAGFSPKESSGEDGERKVFVQPHGIFPSIEIQETGRSQISLKVESVREFLFANGLQSEIIGSSESAIRYATIEKTADVEVRVIERHGVPNWQSTAGTSDAAALQTVFESFLLRPRDFEHAAKGFQTAQDLISFGIEKLGVARTCDLFFACERYYWESRNQAARTQGELQRTIGVGWANHDHHTYRSSREMFANLVTTLELLGFHCRERFYAGSEAGWGAQVLEQPDCGIVIFADVDLDERELSGDFAHDGLEPKKELETIGMWCALHGEAFLQAGLHHLECQFDYQAARENLRRHNINCMDPFTNFDHLKQCFTEPEIWPVKEARIERLLSANQISVEQAEKFRTAGAVGSHLEILERNDGYKGFNQTGVSQIIAKTDPRSI